MVIEKGTHTHDLYVYITIIMLVNGIQIPDVLDAFLNVWNHDALCKSFLKISFIERNMLYNLYKTAPIET